MAALERAEVDRQIREGAGRASAFDQPPALSLEGDEAATGPKGPQRANGNFSKRVTGR